MNELQTKSNITSERVRS